MFDNILLVCRNVANAQNLSRGRSTVQPYDNNTPSLAFKLCPYFISSGKLVLPLVEPEEVVLASLKYKISTLCKTY